MAGIKQKFEDAAVELVEAKKKVVEAQAKFDLLFKQVKRGTNQSTNGQPAEELEQPEKIGEQIVSKLQSDSGREWSYQQLEVALPEIPKNSLRAFLFKLKGQNKAQKVGRGKWKAM